MSAGAETPAASVDRSVSSSQSASKSIRSDRLGHSDQPGYPSVIVPDYDPESGNEDDEARHPPVGVVGLAWESWWSTRLLGGRGLRPGRASLVGGPPRWFPIRC